MNADLASVKYVEDEDSALVLLLNISSIVPALGGGKLSFTLLLGIRRFSLQEQSIRLVGFPPSTFLVLWYMPLAEDRGFVSNAVL